MSTDHNTTTGDDHSARVLYVASVVMYLLACAVFSLGQHDFALLAALGAIWIKPS